MQTANPWHVLWNSMAYAYSSDDRLEQRPISQSYSVGCSLARCVAGAPPTPAWPPFYVRDPPPAGSRRVRLVDSRPRSWTQSGASSAKAGFAAGAQKPPCTPVRELLSGFPASWPFALHGCAFVRTLWLNPAGFALQSWTSRAASVRLPSLHSSRPVEHAAGVHCPRHASRTQRAACP